MSGGTRQGRRWARGVLVLLLVSWTAFLGERPVLPKSLEKDAPFHVPPGFVVERVAGPPLVEHPMMAGFDDRGRLFVADSAGLNLNFEELRKQLPNRIRLLEDTNSDGRFDKSSVFADRLTFPMGALWHDGALYTTAAPSLWRLEDSQGKGVADRRRELVAGFSSVGNGADIHGPFLGPDGRLYWTKGRHPHTIHLPDGRVLQGKAARIFRCRPDGREVEVVCGGGMDDPVAIAFTPEGEAIASVDILLGRPQRHDALIYCIEGGVYPYAEDVLGEFQRTGDLLPAAADLGWVAPAGLRRYRGDAFGPAYRDNLFLAEFNRHAVRRHVLERDGAGFRTRAEDFLVSDDPDFHPTDVLEDADGSLLVIDTGGWFRIGCPTSQIAKPEIPGAIYRIRRADAPRPGDPRGLAIPWDRLTPRELASLLDDPRFVVRDRAVEELAHQGDRALPALQEILNSHPSARARRNVVWTATRLEKGGARAVLRQGLKDRDPGVRIAAAHGAGLLRDVEALPLLEKLTVGDVPAVRREAGTALGRVRRAEAVPALFDSLRAGGDRFLEHASIFALIEIADRPATLKGLQDPSPVVRRGALIALDQMDGGNLRPELVAPLLSSSEPALRKAALAVLTAHPNWTREMIGLLRSWLEQDRLDPTLQESLRGALPALCRDREVQELVTRILHREQTSVPLRLLLLEIMAQVPPDRLPAAWVAELGRALAHPDSRVVRQAIATLRTAGTTDFDENLLTLARDPARKDDLRLAALATAASRMPHLEPCLFHFLTGQLDPETSPLDRLTAAQTLGASRLSNDQLEELTRFIAAAGVLELPSLMPAYEHSADAEVGGKLLAALEQSPGRSGLSPEILRRALQSYPAALRKKAQPLLQSLEVDRGRQQARLAELEPVLTGGDPVRGRDIFFGKKAACATCHTIGGEGGRVGPDLSRIGAIRTGRDLLEAIVFPSASLVRGYEPYIITTHDGRVQTGILARETADALYLVTAERAEARIPRSAIETLQPSRVSLMPQGLDSQLSRQELGDVIAYLRSLR